MSLLNKMLRDLDTRRAADSERQSLPGEVRPLPPARRSSVMPLVAGGVALAAALAGLFWWAPWVPSVPPPLVMPPSPPPVPVPPPAANAPATAPAPQPAPDKGTVVQAPGDGARLKLASELPAPKEAKSREASPGRPGDNAKRDTSAEPASPRKETPPGRSSFDKSPTVNSPQGQAESEYRRGQGLIAQGAGAEGEAALRLALRLAPEHAQARQAMFMLLMDQQRRDEARALLEEGLRILPGHSSWAMNVARFQMESRDAAGAWETLQRSLPSAQGNGEYRAFCGTVLQRLGRHKDAIEHLNAALRINPGEGRWWMSLALVLEADNHPAEAKEAYRRAKDSGNLPADLAAYADQKSR